MPPIRLQKIISRAGLASRRAAEDLIREGRVQVNGRTATLGESADPATDAVRVDGKRVRLSSVPSTYLLLNKPKGYVTAVSDPESRDTVMDLLPARVRRGVRPVGRLDVQTEGLLLLTDDGELARDVTHPSTGCPKEYQVKVSGVPAENDLDRLRRGIALDGIRTRPVRIERVSTTASRGEGNSWFRVVLREGRTRQIRRMFESIGHPVSKLKRVAIGPVRDERLPVGAYRALSPREVNLLKRSLRPDSRAPLPASRPREIPSRRSSPATRRPRSRRP